MSNLRNVLIAGDSLDFVESGASYPATAGWAMAYRLVPRATTVGTATATAFVLASTATGVDHRFVQTPAQTGTWVPGDYTWLQYVTQTTGTTTSSRVTLGTGQLDIETNPLALAAGTDTRTHIEKVLAAIEALIEGRTDVEEYSIGDRSIKRMSVSDLMKWRNIYRQELRSAQTADRIAAGLGARKVQVVLR